MFIIYQLQTDTPTLILTALLLGLIAGSFLNVVIYRLPIMLNNRYRRDCLEFLGKAAEPVTKTFNLLWPRSHCPNCGKTIPLRHNIPIWSFAWLRGKCPHCANKISWRYPLVEFLSATLTVLIAWHYGFSWQTLIVAIFAWSLIVVSFIDYQEKILPDEITLGLLWLGLLANAFNLFTHPEMAIFGAFFGYSSLWLIAKLFKVIRHKEGLGRGDFKLFAALGALLGWQILPLIILLASLLGSVVGISMVLSQRFKFSDPLPFGPYLAIGGVIALLYGNNLWQFAQIIAWHV